MIKTYVDFELRQPLEKTADEAMDEIIETLFNRVRNGKAKEILLIVMDAFVIGAEAGAKIFNGERRQSHENDHKAAVM